MAHARDDPPRRVAQSAVGLEFDGRVDARVRVFALRSLARRVSMGDSRWLTRTHPQTIAATCNNVVTLAGLPGGESARNSLRCGGTTFLSAEWESVDAIQVVEGYNIYFVVDGDRRHTKGVDPYMLGAPRTKCAVKHRLRLADTEKQSPGQSGQGAQILLCRRLSGCMGRRGWEEKHCCSVKVYYLVMLIVTIIRIAWLKHR